MMYLDQEQMELINKKMGKKLSKLDHNVLTPCPFPITTMALGEEGDDWVEYK